MVVTVCMDVKGSKSATNFNIPHSAPGTLYYYYSGNESAGNLIKMSLVARGDTGAQGRTGAQGATGSQGSTGAQGSTGTQGAQGATGYQGAKGSDGILGGTGAQGATGSQGSTGAQGFQGEAGTAVFKGDTGAKAQPVLRVPIWVCLSLLFLKVTLVHKVPKVFPGLCQMKFKPFLNI